MYKECVCNRMGCFWGEGTEMNERERQENGMNAVK